MKILRKINYRYYLCILITIIFLLFSLNFIRSFIRTWEAVKDFGLSIYYYFTELFYLPRAIEPTLNQIGYFDKVNDPFSFLSLENFGVYFNLGFHAFINLDSFLFYVQKVGVGLNLFVRILLMIIPIFLLLYLKFKGYFKEQSLKVTADSIPLIFYKKLESKFIIPLKNWIRSFICFVRDHRYFLTIWIIIWLFYFNVFTIAIEFLAFYFYFVMSFDLVSIFIQFYKLILDLIPMLRFVPLIFWIILAIFIFHKTRKKIALQILNHHEMRNRGFINQMGLSSMICSPTGKGKTTLLTDMGLSISVMFRDKALEKILENDLKFPNFPYINLENELKQAIQFHQVYNLATCKLWINKKQARFIKNPIQEKCFGYDYEKYGLFYYDGAKEISLFQMLENYVQLYFVYVMESSLLVTNYSVREDSVLKDLGNFPLWHSDFFNTDSEYMKAYSRHSHILDFDMLRLGKTVVEDNKKRDLFEFGVVLITEGGKERGNMTDTKSLKKDSDKANQLNDLFNSWLKLVRHSATIDNYPFIRIIFDEQRPESLGADAREVCEKIVFIEEKKENQSSLLFFQLETMIHDFLDSKFGDIYFNYRYYRSDNTLLEYLLKNFWASYTHYYERLDNQFSYHQLILSSKKGTLDQTFGTSKYYISHKKVYSDRFATDAFHDYFMQKSIKSQYGLNDLPEFEDLCANIDELASENSYFINELLRIRKL